MGEFCKTADLVEKEPWSLREASNYLRTWVKENADGVQKVPPTFTLEKASLFDQPAEKLANLEQYQEFAPDPPKPVRVEEGPPPGAKPKPAPKPASKAKSSAKAKAKAKAKASASSTPKAKPKSKAQAKRVAAVKAAVKAKAKPASKAKVAAAKRKRATCLFCFTGSLHLLSGECLIVQKHATRAASLLNPAGSPFHIFRSKDGSESHGPAPDAGNPGAPRRRRVKKPQTSLGCSKCRYTSCTQCKTAFALWQQRREA